MSPATTTVRVAVATTTAPPRATPAPFDLRPPRPLLTRAQVERRLALEDALRG
ncbi:MAG TPA: hypothetical protein VF746_14705 [Longimicrobium sp.]|jgi:hypothetical protein